MFEKEAEEYNQKVPFNPLNVEKEIRRAFQKGAEFGYNKAKEDAEKMKSRFLELCNLKDMRIEELEKANEWHYVKDGDLPKGEGAVLIYWKSGDIKCASVVEPYKVTEDTHIIAWKEIVLPTDLLFEKG